MTRVGPTWLLALVQFGLLVAGGCASFVAAPLPREAEVAPRRAFTASRFRVATTELQRVARAPIEVDLGDGLDPDEAAVLAVLMNYDLIAAREAHGEASAQLLIAGILPNPRLDAGLNHPYGAGSAGTTNALNLSLSMDLKPFIARSARRNAASKTIEQVDLGIAWHEWQIAQDARLLVVRLGWIRKRLKLARDELEFMQQASNATSAASRSGDATLDTLGLQQAALERVRRALNELEQTDVDTDSALRSLLGNPVLDRLEVSEPSSSAALDAWVLDIESCLEGRLDLLALRRGHEAGEERLRAAVLEQFPAVSVGLAYQRSEVALNFIGGFVTVELPVFDRNQGAVKLGEASRRRLEYEYAARVANARGDLDRLLRFASLLRRQLPDVEQSVAPLAEIELREREAVVHGDIPLLSYQAVRGTLFDQRLQATVMAQALAEARIGVETTCGGERQTRP